MIDSRENSNVREENSQGSKPPEKDAKKVVGKLCRMNKKRS